MVQSRDKRAYFPLFLVILSAFEATSTTAFGWRHASSPTFKCVKTGNRSRTALFAKLWDRLQIKEDEEPFWYLLNCIAGLEMDLMRQCRASCQNMPDAIKFVVPTERKTRSHGANRMVTEDKIKYPGYVFAKLRLCPEVYEAIQTLDLCRSWMGTVNRKGHKKLPPAPVALNELEIENFGLEELENVEKEESSDNIIVDDEENDVIDEASALIDQEALKVYLGLKVEDMVKVTKKCNFFGEDGIVRRLKDGRVLIRFYTYGSMYEEWMEPGDVRALSNIEILKGLSGPSQPVSQRDFDGPGDRRGDRWSSGSYGGSLRQDLMGNVKGSRVRNRRRDRVERGVKFRRDQYPSEIDRRREQRNWEGYQESQRQTPGGSRSERMDDEWSFTAGSQQGDDQAALSDVDSQWGRPPSQRQRRKEQRRRRTMDTNNVQSAIDGKDDWSVFMSSESGKKTDVAASDDDEFFASLMDDLSTDLDSDVTKSDEGTPTAKEKDTAATSYSPVAGMPLTDDDFFLSLEAELGTAFDDDTSSDSTSSNFDDDVDGFFAKLEAEMMVSDSPSSATATMQVKDEQSSELKPDDVKETETKNENGRLSGSRRSNQEPSSLPSDYAKLTVPVLKDMLRERGLKVSGKKAELVERLQQY